MRCRECGLELDERDRLRNGAYQCPECGTIHHTASSSKASPSPWRRQRRRSRSASVVDALTRRYWLLPAWGYIAIVLVVLVALILLLSLGGGKDSAANPEMPIVDDIPQTVESQDSLQDSPDELPAESEDTQGEENALPAAPKTIEAAGHTGIGVNDFSVSFDWAMGKLKYSSALTSVSDEINASGEHVYNYAYEDWFTVVLAVDSNTSAIRSAVATLSAAESNQESTRMLSAFTTMLYCFDNTLGATKAQSEVKGMLADNVRTYGTNAFVAKIISTGAETYTMQVTGKL